MTTEHSTYTYKSGAQATVALTLSPATPRGHAVIKIDYNDGQIVDCYVNTGWLRDRLDDLGEPRRTDPRPLTPDAITDEMVTRSMVHQYGVSEEQAVSSAWELDREHTRAALVAALTEPTRPEGAEKLAALIARAFDECDEWDDHDQLADYLATRLLDPTVKDVN